MTIKIHRRGLDSLTIRFRPKNPEKYNQFIENILSTWFTSGKSAPVEFIGHKLKGRVGKYPDSEYPINLRSKDTIHIGLMRRYTDYHDPIELKFVQPYVWGTPIINALQIKKDLEFHVGPLIEKVHRMDISVFFSGWSVSMEDYSKMKTTSPNRGLKGKLIETITAGTISHETPQMNLYNKSKFLSAHPNRPSPATLLYPPLPYGKDLWNLEFAFNRNVLNSFGATTIKEAAKAVPSLWHHATNNFVIFPGESEAVSDHWIKLQNAFSEKNQKLLLRKSKKKHNPNLSYRYQQAFSWLKACIEIERSKDVVGEKIMEFIQSQE